jgi:murein DD-endopeptidase MepM/ murein hydrolase activator NlpD
VDLRVFGREYGTRAGALAGDRRRRLVPLAALFVAVLFLGQVPAPAAADHDVNHTLRQITELNRAIQQSRQAADRYRQASVQYQSAAAAAEARIAQLARQEAEAKTEAEQLSAHIALVEEQLSVVTLQLNETIAHLGALRAAIEEGEKTLTRRQELYGQHLRQLYRQSQVTPIEMLLSSSSLADFAERVQLMLLIVRQDQQLADDIRKLQESNEEKRVTAELKQEEIEGLKKQVTVQREQLVADKQRLDQLIASTQYARRQNEATMNWAEQNAQYASGAAKQAQLQAADLERRKQQVEALYAQLVARLQGSSGLSQPWRGRLAAWPLSGPITSYFGYRWGGFHNGIDIAAPMYTPVRAAHSGRVQVVGKPYLAYGDTAEVVIIAHASNMSTIYGHLDDRAYRPVVAPGQWVNAGQVIAYVGMTGWTTGPHTHFMTVLNGQPVNPLSYLP